VVSVYLDCCLIFFAEVMVIVMVGGCLVSALFFDKKITRQHKRKLFIEINFWFLFLAGFRLFVVKMVFG